MKREKRRANKIAYDAQPLSFRIPKNESDAAWQRAQVWLAQNPTGSVSPVETVTDHMIQTKQLYSSTPHNPSLFGPPTAITVTRIDKGDLVEVRVQSLRPNRTIAPTLGSRSLAHYMQTGNEACLTPLKDRRPVYDCWDEE